MTLAAPPPLRKTITLGRAFLPLLHFTDPFILVESPRGCLKTCSILNILMMRAAKWPGKRWYIWRSTRALLSTTVLPSFEEYVIPQWDNVRGMRLLNPAARPTQRSEYIFENGSVFLPIGLDDILRGTSAEGAGGYLAEAIELEAVEQATALAGMMRQPGVPFHQVICDVNPGPPGHWANQVCEPIDPKLRRVVTIEDYERLQAYNSTPATNPTQRWKRIVAKIQDNPHYFDVVKWANTEPGGAFLSTLDVIRSPHLRRRWIDGEWVAASGTVFPEFDEDQHVIDPFPIPDSWPCWWFHDAGYDHPAATLLLCLAPNGRTFLIDEHYGGGWRVPKHAEWIKSRNEGRNVRGYFGDPRDCFKEIEQGPSIASQFKELGLSFEKWPAKSGVAVQHQVELVSKALTRQIDGKPAFQIFRTCPSTIMEFQSWSYKRTTSGELPAGDDAYEDKNNHAIDCMLGYFALGLKFAPERVHRFGEAKKAEPVVIAGRKRWYGDEEE